jgi:hypothetical protein
MAGASAILPASRRGRFRRPLPCGNLIRALALVAALAAPACAHAAPACAPSAEVIARLADKYGETLQAEGLRGGTSIVQIYANAETGTWTVLDVGVSGLACMISAGEAWSGPLPQEPAGDDL